MSKPARIMNNLFTVAHETSLGWHIIKTNDTYPPVFLTYKAASDYISNNYIKIKQVKVVAMQLIRQ